MTAGDGVQRASTFAMLDLAGYTALTEQHGDLHAADLAIEFAELARRCLRDGDRLIKSIGDAVLLASSDPQSGIKLVERILDGLGGLDSIPLIRAGMHHGDAIEHEGDVFGTAVNLVARVSAQARGGQVLSTRSILDAAHTLGVSVQHVGSAKLKNLSEPYDLYELEIGPGRIEGGVDPVCHMWVERSKAKGCHQYGGDTYWFCSVPCASRFAEAPSAFVGQNTTAKEMN